jgi:arylsulfatase A-like enzyme
MSHVYSRTFGVFLLLLLFGGCRANDFLLRPAVRFADPAEQAALTSYCGDQTEVRAHFEQGNEAVATIGDDVRLVLSVAKRRPLFFVESIAMPESRKLAFSVDVPPEMQDAGVLLVEPMYRRGVVWSKLPGQIAEPTSSGGMSKVSIRFDVPSDIPPGETIGLHAMTYIRTCAEWRAHETSLRAVPERARLDFSIGMAQASRDGESAQFVIEACPDGDECRVVFEESLHRDHAAYEGWADRSIDLRDLAGKQVRFRFRTRGSADNALRTIPVWGDPTIYQQSEADPARTNVILISLDTLSAPHLGTYGYEHDTAPFLDEMFGRGGTTFERCVAAASSTSPSHMTMFSGRSPSVNSVTTGMEALPSYFPVVTEAIRSAGISTGAVTENGWLGVQHGFGRGFGAYVENKSPDIMTPTGQVTLTLQKARQWLMTHQNQQFFLFIHTFQVHDPFTPPRDYQDLFPTIAGMEIHTDSALHLREHRAYDQEIRFTDGELRKFFGGLREDGFLDDTVVLIVSDHGENFGEHGWMGHGAELYEQVTHVPLLVAGKGVAKGRRLRGLVGHLDLAPTIADIFGVAAPVNAEGRSLLPLLQGAPDPPEARVLVTESWGAGTKNIAYEPVRFLRPAFAVRRGDRKLVRYRDEAGFRFEYYDLLADPGENHDLYQARPKDAEDLVDFVTSYEERAHAAREAQKNSAGQPAAASEEPDMDPRAREKLKALGYLQ